MELSHLLNAAGVIAKRNLSVNVNSVTVEWSQDKAALKLFHYFDLSPTSADLELQELSMCELLAEFPDIRSSECISLTQPFEEAAQSKRNIVYVRST